MSIKHFSVNLGNAENGTTVIKNLNDLRSIYVAGGGGKSRFLTSFIISLVENTPAEEISVVMCNPRRADWDLCWGDLPHVSIADKEQTLDCLQNIVAEIEKRKSMGEDSLHLPKRFVFIGDTYDLMNNEKKRIVDYIKTIATQGPDVGIYSLVTGYPWMIDSNYITQDIIDCFDTKILFQADAGKNDYKMLFGDEEFSKTPIPTDEKRGSDLHGNAAMMEKNGDRTRFVINYEDKRDNARTIFKLFGDYHKSYQYDRFVMQKAGYHIQSMARKHNLETPKDFTFIKTERLYPAFDDMNFRYKNKMFSILFDVILNGKSKLEEYRKYKHIHMAKNNNMIPVVFPILVDFPMEHGPHGYGIYVGPDRRVKTTYNVKDKDSWNLFDAETGEPIDPLAIADDAAVKMSRYEQENFAVQIACNLIKEKGGGLIQVSDNASHIPQIVFRTNTGQLQWCAVSVTDEDWDETKGSWLGASQSIIDGNRYISKVMTEENGMFLHVYIENSERGGKIHYKYKSIDVPRGVKWNNLLRNEYTKWQNLVTGVDESEMGYTYVDVITAKETVTFKMLEPQTDEQSARGLSQFDQILEKTGMIYFSTNPREPGHPCFQANMNTANTKFPVDFLFIDWCGNIIQIDKNVPALSSEIHTASNVVAVMEINAGECDKYGIEVGDSVIHEKLRIRPGNKVLYKEMMFDKLTERTLDRINPEDIMFFAIAEGGAMGWAGAIQIITKNKDGIGLYFIDYTTFKDLTSIEKLFPPVKWVETNTVGNKDWFMRPMGFGNHLILRTEYYEEFKDLIKGKHVYKEWLNVAIELLTE